MIHTETARGTVTVREISLRRRNFAKTVSPGATLDLERWATSPECHQWNYIIIHGKPASRHPSRNIVVMTSLTTVGHFIFLREFPLRIR